MKTNRKLLFTVGVFVAVICSFALLSRARAVSDRNTVDTTEQKYTTEDVGQVDKVSNDKIVQMAEVAPEFNGGFQALTKWIGSELKYPEEAHKKNIEGRVVAEFVVWNDGTIRNTKIFQSADPLLDAETLRVLSKMPKWKPGTTDGKAVNCKYSLPFTFKIPEDKKVN
ncbi:MAG: energy transducer TonB [Bacteroidales bacterium]